MAPENKASEGKNLWDLSDKNGVKVVQEVIGASKNGGGFFEYMWLNPQTGKDEKKLSYAAPVKIGEIEIAVGTGTYLPMIENSKAMVVELINRTEKSVILPVTILCTVVIIIVLSFLYMFMKKRIVYPIGKLTEIAETIAEDKLSVVIEEIESKDEIGALSRSFKKMHTNLKNIALAAEEIAKGNIMNNGKVESISYVNGDLSNAFCKQVNYIKNVISDIEDLVKDVVDGKLSTRIKNDNYSGDFKRIIDGINNTIDAIINPIKEALLVLKELSQGNLNVSVEGDYKGEHAEIKVALNTTIIYLQKYINDISSILSEISKGNLDISVSLNYEGNFAEIKEALNKIIDSLNRVLGDINNSSEQVAVGSRQVSDASQSLAQGSSEQAVSIEQLTSSMNQVAQQTKQNAQNAGMASQKANMVKEYASQGNKRMLEMLKAMEDINLSSKNISKIIKVIDEIAFQTNILSLNAAVEAARAGSYGKGFAVVAEEVRNLATRSADAAKETTTLIEGSIRNIESGSFIANETAQALHKIVDGVSDATELVGNIANSSNEQATSISQVNQSINQVSQVTQTNSATAEQQAASSQELSSQAEILKDMLSMFKLRGQKGVSNISKKPNVYDLDKEVIEILKKNINLDD